MDLTPINKGAPGRRESSRRQGARENKERRNESERRNSSVKRVTVDFFHALRMPKIADVFKTTKLVEPAFMVVTLILSGVVNAQTMGWGVGFGFIIALSFHEYGHYRAAKNEGYTPEPWWFIPVLGAIMRLPQITSRLHEARIAFGGPLLGFIFTLATSLLWLVLSLLPHAFGLGDFNAALFAIVVVSAVLNLFNLIPIAPLDGGRISQAMNGAWPELMRIVGFVSLLGFTAWTRQATMLVVWILVIGQFRTAFRGREYSKCWRFYASLILLLIMSGKLGYDVFVAKSVFGWWRMFGEVAYGLVGTYFVWEYYQQWKYPGRFTPDNDFRAQQVGRRDGEIVRLRYFALISAFLGLLSILILLSDKLK